MNAIEEANLAFAQRYVQKLSSTIPSGTIIMVTDGKELALTKETRFAQDIYEFEDHAATVASAMGLKHEEENVLFITVE